MTEADKQALSIYETIVATSKERRNGFNSIAEMLREQLTWKTQNPGLSALGRATPEVLFAFLDESIEWLRCECSVGRNRFSGIGAAIDAGLTGQRLNSKVPHSLC